MKQLFLLTALLGLLGFASCSDNLNADGPTPTPPGSGEEVELHMSLQKPGMGAIGYSTIWIDNEADVDTLDIYVFSDKKERTDKPGAYTLESIVPQDTARATHVQGNITLQLKLEGRTQNRRIYFVANGSRQNSLRFVDEINWTTEEEFLASLTNAEAQQTPLLMTAYLAISAADLSTVGTDNKFQLVDKVELKRAVARIDIENHERMLIIDSVQLFNTPKESYIMPQATNALEEGLTEFTSWPILNIRTHKTVAEGGVAAPDSFWKVPVKHDDPTVGDSVYIPSIYFPYESVAAGDKAKRQKIRIWGRVGSGDLTDESKGDRVTYEVALQAEGDSIARNHRYILLIRNILGSDLECEFKVKAWESSEQDTVIYEVDAANPSVTLNNDRLPGKTLEVAQTGGVMTLKVDCNIQWGVEYEGVDVSSWVSHKIMMDASTEAGENEIGKYLQLTIGANATGVERGYGDVWIKIYNKANPGKMYRFTIRQATT